MSKHDVTAHRCSSLRRRVFVSASNLRRTPIHDSFRRGPWSPCTLLSLTLTYSNFIMRVLTPVVVFSRVCFTTTSYRLMTKPGAKPVLLGQPFFITMITLLFLLTPYFEIEHVLGAIFFSLVLDCFYPTALLGGWIKQGIKYLFPPSKKESK